MIPPAALAPDRTERVLGWASLALLAAALTAGALTFPFHRLLGRWLFG